MTILYPRCLIVLAQLDSDESHTFVPCCNLSYIRGCSHLRCERSLPSQQTRARGIRLGQDQDQDRTRTSCRCSWSRSLPTWPTNMRDHKHRSETHSSCMQAAAHRTASKVPSSLLLLMARGRLQVACLFACLSHARAATCSSDPACRRTSRTTRARIHASSNERAPDNQPNRRHMAPLI